MGEFALTVDQHSVGGQRPTVVVICGDPGGASALAPVVIRLRDGGKVTVVAMAYRQAITVWEAQKIDHQTVSENLGMGEAAKLLNGWNARLLLCGTSINGVDLELIFMQAANEIGLPSLAVLDFWTNYRRRFTSKPGELVIPDRIAVMDEQAREEIVASGFPSGRVEITGQPAFDQFAAPCIRDYSTRSRELRNSLGVGIQDRLVLFASQPLSDLHGYDTSSPGHPGYTEATALPMVIRALEEVAYEDSVCISLLVRPHPRESLAMYDWVSSSSIKVLVSAAHGLHAVLVAADLVTGMTSVALVEACYLGCIVLSIQPGLEGPDPVPTNRSGLSAAAYTEDEARELLRRLLLDESAIAKMKRRLMDMGCDGQAGDRICNLTYRMLDLS
jgi:hypothetical protein